MQWFSKNAVFFAVKTCLAAFLALYFALELNLDKPAWALTTVFVSSQLYSASTISKSVFRLLGTLLGAVFIFFIFPITVEHPLLFSLCVSLWVSVCLYLSLHDRTPKSYVFMLAGYSAAIMGFPEVTTPLGITSTVLSRIEEITLGIVCSSLVHGLLFPVSMRSLLEQSVSQWYLNARKLCGDLLSGIATAKSPERDDILIRMATNPQQVEILITHCVYEGNAARQLIRLVSVQYQHLSYLIPTLIAIEIRLQRLSELHISFPENVAQTFRQFLLWLHDGEAVGETHEIQQTLAACQTELNQAWRLGELPTESCLLLTGVVERLTDFVRIAGAYQSVGGLVSDLSGDTSLARGKRTHRFYDKGLIRLSALTAFCATFGSCLLWMATGWRDGASAPVMAAILSSFFASLDTPLTSMKLFVRGVIVAIIISVVYVAILLPQATSFEALMICLAPGLILLGLMIARPTTNMIGLSVAIQIPGFIGLGHHLRPDLVALFNTAIASMTGVLFAVILTAIMRNKRPSWTARRAVRIGLRELLRFIKETERNGSSLLGRQRYIGLMLDKLNVVLPRLRLDPQPDMTAAGMLLTEVWLGVNSFDYYARHKDLLAKYQLDSGQMFHELGLFLKRRLKSLQTPPHPDLLDEIDTLLLMLERLAMWDESLLTPLFHLASVRLYLFPQQAWPVMNSRQAELMQQKMYRLPLR
ncbi:FUSC family protein [Pantoea sp. At-9b]|uniref:FUSC family protein n=1 Tax=Pantoea sp. (strain At-9b) TaxID=592316 RepID=UPI0001B3EEBB|nr:FUSC family protein [Pantoea sp. At-9b]ADU71735.1 Fusaric acid resistance protein conserved region [Pantoea sp. At-9b]